MTSPDSLPTEYRLGVGIMLLNTDKKVFVGQRLDMISDAWQMPQGGIDKGEDPKEAMLRELEEETGVVNVKLIAESKDWISYDLPEDLLHQLWEGKYKGQKQKWFLAELEGSECQINIATEEPEFREWQWVDPSILPNIIVPFKVELYKKVLEEFQPIIDSL